MPTKKSRKPTYTWKLNNTLLIDNCVREEIIKVIIDFYNFMKKRKNIPKPIEHKESSAKIKIHSSECFQKETGENIH